MPTIAEQLTQLASDRDDLVSNLTTKGITGLTGDETFTELVPEVLNIPSGGDVSDYFTDTISANTYARSLVKKFPTITLSQNVTSLYGFFQYMTALIEAPMINTENVTTMQSMFEGLTNLLLVPVYNTQSVTNMRAMLRNCTSLETAPLFNTQNVQNFSQMFYQCRNNLKNIPQYNTSSGTNFTDMFFQDYGLTDESLNNILGMCINATSFTGTKDLTSFGLNATYPASRIQALSNYQAFIDAGWTIGWS